MKRFSFIMILFLLMVFLTPIGDSFHTEISSKSVSQLLPSEVPDPQFENDLIVGLVEFQSFKDRELVLQDTKEFNYAVLKQYNLLPLTKIRISPNKVQSLVKRPEILQFQRNHQFNVLPDFRNRISLLESTALEETSWSSIGADKLWQLGYEGEGIKIAILDSGISSTHVDLKDRVAVQESFVNESNGYTLDEDEEDYHGHGTHVAGIAAGSGEASSNNKFRGLAPKATLFNLKVADRWGSATDDAIIQAIERAVELDADIISISLGSGGSPDSLTSKAVDAAVEKGVIVAVAVGNSGDDFFTTSEPAMARKAISVGASLHNGTLASFSSRGPTPDYRVDPDILSPGVNVIGPLAAESIIDFAAQAYTTSNIINGRNGNYIGLSGTSMATPAVAGAAALLLEASLGLSKASPYIIRAAFQETAVKAQSEDADPFSQGTGLINSSAAYELLTQSYNSSSGEYNLLTALPKQISEFPEKIKFPGDSANLKLVLLSGRSSDQVQVELLGNPSFAEIALDDLTEPIFGYHEFFVNVSVPLETLPGNYNFSVRISTSSGLSQTVNFGPFSVNFPGLKVYWDLFHTEPQDSVFRNYYYLYEHLVNLGYDVDEVDEPISPLLRNYDILVIPDAELGFSEPEEEEIHNFIRDGGGLLLLSSFYPYTAIESYNNITTQFGIEFNKESIKNQTDQGIAEVFSELPLSVSIDESHIIFSGVSKFQWTVGTSLRTFGDAKPIANLTDSGKNVIGIFEGNSTVKGRIVATGSELQFYKRHFLDSNNKILATNIFHWLSQDNQATKMMVSSNQSQIEAGDTITFGAYLLNSTTGKGITGQNVTINLYQPNASKQLGFMNEIGGGVYSVNIKEPLSFGTHKFELSWDEMGLNRSLRVRSSSGSPYIEEKYEEIVNPSSITFPEWTEDTNSSKVWHSGGLISLGLEFSGDLPIDGVKVYLNSIPEFLPEAVGPSSKAEITYKVLTLSEDQASRIWEGAFQSTKENTQGFYTYFVSVNVSSEIWSINPQDGFLIAGSDPVIDLQKSYLDQTPIEELDNITYRADVPEFSYGENILIKVFKEASGNSNSSEMTAWALLIHYYLFLRSDAIISVMQLSSSGDHWEGDITLPDKNPFYDGAEIKLDGQIYGILLVLRDSHGNYDLEFIPIFISSGGVDPFLLLIIGGIAGIMLLAYMSLRRRRPKYDYYQQIPYQTQISTPYDQVLVQPKFCGECGSSVLPGARHCVNCGSELHKFD